VRDNFAQGGRRVLGGSIGGRQGHFEGTPKPKVPDAARGARPPSGIGR